jgi:F0F1-type ATP synthase gamma subunit
MTLTDKLQMKTVKKIQCKPYPVNEILIGKRTFNTFEENAENVLKKRFRAFIPQDVDLTEYD